MQKASIFLKIFAVLFLACGLISIATQPLSAQVTIPEGSSIDEAVFSIYVFAATNETVNVHRITADWGENSVTWNSFAGSFDPAVIGSFLTDSPGWQSVDVTALVQAWMDDTSPNYGIMLEQGLTPYTNYHSSESAFIDRRPKLEIWYSTPGGDPGYVTIQRPDVSQDGVADAYVWQLKPDQNFNHEILYTGDVRGYEKYTLIRFHFVVVPYGPGVGTPGYWKNHPDAWPVGEIPIGGVLYTREQAINIMMMGVKSDKTYNMFNALVAAKLNVLIGNDDSCIAETIASADIWMATYGPAGNGVEAGGEGSPWREGEPLFEMLDKYNNGELCAYQRD